MNNERLKWGNYCVDCLSTKKWKKFSPFFFWGTRGRRGKFILLRCCKINCVKWYGNNCVIFPESRVVVVVGEEKEIYTRSSEWIQKKNEIKSILVDSCDSLAILITSLDIDDDSAESHSKKFLLAISNNHNSNSSNASYECKTHARMTIILTNLNITHFVLISKVDRLETRRDCSIWAMLSWGFPLEEEFPCRIFSPTLCGIYFHSLSYISYDTETTSWIFFMCTLVNVEMSTKKFISTSNSTPAHAHMPRMKPANCGFSCESENLFYLLTLPTDEVWVSLVRRKNLLTEHLYHIVVWSVIIKIIFYRQPQPKSFDTSSVSKKDYKLLSQHKKPSPHICSSFPFFLEFVRVF